MKKRNLNLLLSTLCFLLLFFGCKKNHEPKINQPPQVWAGLDQVVFLPSDTVELKGIASDADGSITSYEWTKLNGPSSSTIVSPFTKNTIVRDLVDGIYTFQLKVTDNRGLSAVDQVAVTVETFRSGAGDWDY